MPPTNTFVQGSVGTTDRIANIQPESWSPTIDRQLPFSKFPLMTMLNSMSDSEKIESRKHHWPEEAFNEYVGAVTDVYTNSSLITAYSSGGVVGTVLYFKVTAAMAAQVRTGDNILITNATNNTLRHASVVSTAINGDTNSYLAGKLLEADTGNILAQADLSWGLMGDANAEGSELPTAVSSDPQYYENQTEIFMEAIEHTGSVLAEKTRVTESKKSRDRKMAMERFLMKQEWSFLFSVLHTTTGPNGKEKRHMKGIRAMLDQYEAANVIDWRTSASYSGSWINSGLNWLRDVSTDASRYARASRKTCFAGIDAWSAINNSVEDRGYFKLETRQNEFGITIKRLVGLVQDWDIVLSPTMSTRNFSNSMFVCEPELLRKKKFRPLTMVKANQAKASGYDWVDGEKEGWFEECTLEAVNLRAMYWLDGIGQAHA